MKKVSWVFNMIIYTLIFTNILSLKVSAVENGLDNVIDDIILTTKSEGKIENYELCQVQITWSIDSDQINSISEGDYVYIFLPEEMSIENKSEMDLIDKDSEEIVGTVTGYKNSVKLSFTNIDYIKQKQEVYGNIYCKVKYTLTNITGKDIDKEMSFKVNDKEFKTYNHV